MSAPRLSRTLSFVAAACALAALLVPFAGRFGLLRVANDVTGMAGLAMILGVWAMLLGGGTVLGALAWRCDRGNRLARWVFAANALLLLAWASLLLYLWA